jgi:integrase
MPRKHPEPFWRDARKCWFVQIGKKQHRLSPDRDEAFQLYHALMSRKPEEKQPTPPPAALLAVEVLDRFLDWVKGQQAARTYEWYQRHLQHIASAIPARLTVAELKPWHVSRVMDAHPGWSANTRNGFARAVQRAFRWAMRQGLIDGAPLAFVEKPALEARETPVTPEEFDKLMEVVKDSAFRDLLIAAWDSGARPIELRQVEVRHCDFTNGRWVFKTRESKGKKRPRVVYLSERLLEICRRRAEQHPTGPLFRNEDGRPWTKDAVNCRFHRLQGKMGRKIALYDLRHGFCSEALKNGVDPVTVANLMGHANTSMVASVYSSLALDPAYLREAMRRAKKSIPSGDA